MKSAERIPHIVEMRIEIVVYQLLICNRIGWTEQNYCDFQFRAGCDFIDKVLHNGESVDKALLRHSAVFWGWWLNQWHSRNLTLYAGRMLSPGRYREAHTTHVIHDTFTVNNFWDKVETMIKDGFERYYREAVQ